MPGFLTWSIYTAEGKEPTSPDTSVASSETLLPKNPKPRSVTFWPLHVITAKRKFLKLGKTSGFFKNLFK